MKVSIITVVYNNERYIDQAIESVLSQDYPDIEYIVKDGGSKDNTMEVVNRYKDRIAKISSERDKGIYDAMNRGIEMTTGEVVGILNSDDIYYDTHTISNIMQVFKENHDVDAVYGNIVYFRENDFDKVVRTWRTKQYGKNFFERGEVPPHPGLFVRKAVYDNIGTYYPNFKISSDYEFMLRAFRVNNYKPYFLDKTIVKMRMGGESTRSIKNIMLGNREIMQAWKMNKLPVPALLYAYRVAKKLKQLV
ncbi:MAG: family 2 glycosyl transferase [Bacteroidetes bacterium]|uniref:glycosyltransferase family 2 protein n=1 Tax=Chitinophaga sp. LS1 TaxID=3051176 RepID=UPI001DAC1EFD|nr:glycosyltransferase family 2 protein [Chitinophaga sp. LS1]MBP1652892.1 family 2 glycosyl transferase [Bacteroidota bacterium]WPV64458.1 glycosyltransferase family 2 protein [Chitinophaga sp. LS1]